MGERSRLLVGIAFGLTLIVSLGLGTPPAAAHHTGSSHAVDTSVSETVTLPENNWTAYTFLIGSGDRLTYNVQVTNGSQIDMYIVPPDGLVDYASETALSFAYFEEAEHRTSASGVYVGNSARAGYTSVILDNVDFSGAMPAGPVTLTVTLTKELAQGPSALVVGGIVIAIIAAIAIVALVLLRRRKRAAAAPPPMSVPPPYAGEAQPPAYPGAPPPPAYPPQPPPAAPPPYGP